MTPAEYFPPFTWRVTDREYHSDRDTWGSTQLRRYAIDPAKFWAEHLETVAAWKTTREDTSSALALGSLLHLCALEPYAVTRWIPIRRSVRVSRRRSVEVKVFGCRYCEIEAPRRSEAFRSASAQMGLPLAVTPTENRTAAAIIGNLLAQRTEASRRAMVLLCGCLAEQPIRGEVNGLAMRAKPDGLNLVKGEPVEVSVKTTAQFEQWVRHYERERFDLSHALYSELIYQHTGSVEPAMAHYVRCEVIVLETIPPYRVMVKPISDETCESSRVELYEVIERFREALAGGTRGHFLSPWEGMGEL